MSRVFQDFFILFQEICQDIWNEMLHILEKFNFLILSKVVLNSLGMILYLA